MNLNIEKSRVEARDKRREEYFAGIKNNYFGEMGARGYMRHIRKYFTKLIAELDSGAVDAKWYWWGLIDFIATFDMTYSYVCEDFDEENSPYVDNDTLDETRDIAELKQLVLEYLTAAGALARRIGSDTYVLLREMIVSVQFDDRSGIQLFKPQAYAEFKEKLERAICLLWADNEMAKKVQTIA